MCIHWLHTIICYQYRCLYIPYAAFSRSLSDDEAPANEPINAQVLFSTPVSSLKAPRSTMLKLKTTRFQLPASTEKMCHKSQHSISTSARYINVSLTQMIIAIFRQLIIKQYDYIFRIQQCHQSIQAEPSMERQR